MDEAAVVEITPPSMNGKAEPPQMTLQQAWSNVVLAARKFQGDADAHDAIRDSLRIVGEFVQAASM